MGDWKEELRTLVQKKKRSGQEIDSLVQENIDTLRRSRQGAQGFIEDVVLPALREIKDVMQSDFADVRIESIELGASLIMASGAKSPGERRRTNELEYRVTVDMFKKTAEGALLMLNVVPGSVSQKDHLVGRLEVDKNRDGTDSFAITPEDIRNNFLTLFRSYVN